MTHPLSRREVLSGACVVAAAPALVWCSGTALAVEPSQSPGVFPAQDPARVREIVGASHGNLERVAILLKESPQLANAAYDWGFGDWETPIGAASHTGRVAIAELLLLNGARPDLFTYTMLGHLDVVKAALTAQPDMARTRGPHGINLMAHANVGGDGATAVVEYLKTLPNADIAYTNLPVDADALKVMLGQYRFGPGSTEVFDIAQDKSGNLTIKRLESATRRLFHQGNLAFHPAGAEHVRIAFEVIGDTATQLTITAPMPLCVAKRVPKA